ncbi:MAG: hypothetical protein KF686_03210 [Ramlibacter sp.]|nr:hypothetical protein [Ramlibacter sp.]
MNSLAKKAAKGPAPAAYGGAMNVEDMIQFVLFHGPLAADEIERLWRVHGWLMDGLLPDGRRVAPFGRWAEVCIAYGRGGEDAVRPLLRQSESAMFAVAFLENVRSQESVALLIDFCKQSNWSTPDVQADGWRAVQALNVLLSFDDCVVIDQKQIAALEELLKIAFDSASNSRLRSLSLLALRGVATNTALDWISELSLDEASERDVQKTVVKAINRRLSPGWRPRTADERRLVSKERALNA